MSISASTLLTLVPVFKDAALELAKGLGNAVTSYGEGIKNIMTSYGDAVTNISKAVASRIENGGSRHDDGRPAVAVSAAP